jgi:hypothetical protein
MSLYAEIDQAGHVLRVIVCDSQEWCESRLGGTWIETKDDDPQEQYAGIGMGYDPNAVAKFAPPWQQPPNDSPYQPGSWVHHDGKLWQCFAANNVWKPGVFGWRDHTEGNIPRWVQPAGAGDQYRLDDQVMHHSKTWKSNNDANVWEPGAAGIGSNIWEDVTDTSTPEPEGYPAWVQPTGAHDAYVMGARVTHNGKNWENTGSAANVWEPGVFGWIEI